MTNMTKEQRENVMIQGRKMMDNLSEGKSARDVMAQIYVDNLDDKTMNQGYLFITLKCKVIDYCHCLGDFYIFIISNIFY